MQTTSLRYFLAVVRCGSIAGASVHLNVASSAISRQIANLEAELGCALFERRPRGMAPSPAGELLAQHAAHILMRADQATAEIVELQGLVRGLVRVAATEGFALDLLPEIMARFHLRFPGIRFDLAVMPPLRVSEVVAAGEADLGLTFRSGSLREVEIAFERTVAMVGLCSNAHPLAHASDVSLERLQDFPIALMPGNTTARQVFDATCLAAGLSLEPTMTANNLPSILSFVRQTDAVAPLAFLSAIGLIQRGEFACFSLGELDRTSRIVQVQVMRHRGLPQPVRLFLDDLVAALTMSSASGNRPIRITDR